MYRERIYSRYMASGYAQLNRARDLHRASASFDNTYSEYLPADKSVKILEIGCGMGHFQFFLRQKGFLNCVAVDIGQEQIDYCQANLEGEFILVDDTNFYLLNHARVFDVIIMNDVLEHFTKNEAVEILDNIRQALKPGGRLIMRTPNMSCLFSGAGRYGDFTHETGFTERSAIQLLSSVGFLNILCAPEKIFIRSTLKRVLFEIPSFLRLFVLKALVFLERPGDCYPTIFSKNLIIVADMGQV